MYNKKTLTNIVKNLGSAKAPTKKQDIIYDPMGQWTNPGQDTRVPTSNGNITMGANPETGQPIPFPVFAQPNVGPGVMMQPGQDYTFPGAKYVDEFPQVKKGGLVRQSKKYSKSLMAKNILFVKNALLNKKKSVKNKIFDPNSPYFEDGGTFEIELDENEIDQYRNGGYIVEELDTYDGGGEVTINNVTYVKYGDNWVNKSTGEQVKDEGLIYKLYNSKPTEVVTGNPIKPIPLGSKPIAQKIKELGNSPLVVNQEEARRLSEIKRKQDLHNPQVNPDDVKTSKDKSNFRGLEDDLNEALGFPMDKAVIAADAANQDSFAGDQADNFRHTNAGRYTAEGIANYTGNIPYLSNTLGFIGSNLLGIGHEVSSQLNSYSKDLDDRPLLDQLRESGEDIYNNYVGSKVGSSNMTPEQKTNYLLYLSNTNQLPDGIVGSRFPKKGFSNNLYFKKDENDKGQYKSSYANGGALNKFVGGGEPCEQGFERDPVTGECIVITERKQDVQEVRTNQYTPYIAAYEEANPRDAYVYQKKADYLKKYKGLNRSAGVTQDNFNTDVEGNFNSNWEYDRNSEVIKQFAKDNNINPKNHVELVEKMADKGNVSRDMIANSKYGSKLQPSLWARTLAGAQELGNAVVKLLPGEQGDVFNKQTAGLTKKEWDEIHNSSMGALEILSGADVLGAGIMNSVADLSTASGGNYQESPGLLSGELKSNVNPLQAGLANPLVYTGLGELAAGKSLLQLGKLKGASLLEDVSGLTKSKFLKDPTFIPEQTFKKEFYKSYNPKTKDYNVYEINVPQEAIPGRSYADVQHKMKNLRKDLGIGPIEHFINKKFGTKGGIGLDKDAGMVVNNETGRLYDSNTRYWLNREYGINSPAPVNKYQLAKDNGILIEGNLPYEKSEELLFNLNQKEEGGYIDLDLDEDQINEYKEGGYIVEDISIPSLTRMDDGAQVKGLQGLNADFSTNLTAFINAAKADGIDLGIGSGFRSVEKQKQLWEQALKKYGSPEKARKWVAPPGKSNHNKGIAVDLSSSGVFLGKNKNTKATQWAHANAEKYGLHFRMGWEPWHIEPLNLSKEQKAKIDAEHQHSDNEDPNAHVDPNNAEALSKEGIDMTKYYQNLEKEQEITDIDNDYSNWNPQQEVVVDPRVEQLNAYSKLMSPSIQNVNDMYAATKMNQQQQQKQFAMGGYIDTELTDKEITNYKNGGYIVEYLD